MTEHTYQILNPDEAEAVLFRHWEETGATEQQRRSDHEGLFMFFTIRLSNGASIQKSGPGKFLLRYAVADGIPSSVIEEWLSR